jgi:glycosyltransferase involved in cell wall biosynthesis
VTSSIVIATKNRARYVADAIESAVGSSVADEVVVVDGGSTDGSLAELRALGSRIRLVAGSYPNAAATRNAGAAVARGDYIGFLDSDDLMRPAKISCLAPLLDADDAIALAHGRTVVIGEDGAADANATAEQNRQLAEGARRTTTYEGLAAHCAMFTSATLLRRSAFEAVGGYDELLETYEDWDLYLRLSLGYRLVYADCVTASYRIWPGNVGWARTAAGVATVARKHLATLADTPGVDEAAARYAFLRRLASSSHILLDGRGTRRAALEAFRVAPFAAVTDAEVRGSFVRSLLPDPVLRRRRPAT